MYKKGLDLRNNRYGAAPGGEFDPAGTYPEMTVGNLLPGNYPDIVAGDIIPKNADALEVVTNKLAAQTTGGDIDLKTGYSELLRIRGNLDAALNPFIADTFVSTSMNLVDPVATFALGTKTAYFFPVVAGNWGSYGTTQENNGFIVIGEDVDGVYFKATRPTASSYGTAASYHENNGIRYYLPPTIGWLTIVCTGSVVPACHIAWSNYNDDVAGTFANTTKVIATDVSWIHAWGMAALSGGGRSVFDEIDIDNGTRYRRIDRVALASLTWTAVDTEDDTYRYTASVSGMATNGLWACLFNGLVVDSTTLTIESTTIATVEDLLTALDGYLFYFELASVASSATSLETVSMANDFGLTYFLYENEIATVAGLVTEAFRQSGKDMLFNGINYVNGEMSETTAAAIAYLQAQVDGILSGIKNGFPSLIVQQLSVKRHLDAYIVDGNFFLHGAGAPTMIPQWCGQEYYDETNDVWYKAGFTGTAPTAAAWKQITNS